LKVAVNTINHINKQDKKINNRKIV
jgi:hypothetical protein